MAKAPKKVAPTGVTRPSQFRLTPTELADVDELGKLWGPVVPLKRVDVVREAIRRAIAEARKGKTK